MLGEYEALERLAPALFGYVQKYRHVPTGEYVAVKRMELRFAARKRSKSLEDAVAEDLLTEVETNLRVQLLGGHPNVLPLRDCIMEEDAVLLVLKFCHQGELLDVLNTKRAAGQPIHALRYFAQTLRGAAFLHANDIAHRDLSLENVLVDKRDCCYITDFGLATQCHGTMAVKPVGKLRYMAPEVSAALVYQEAQPGEYDPKVADVWALGVMLYAMVAARYPFREPLRNDDRFRLLEDFGVEYLLEKDEVNVQDRKEVVDLLRKMLVADPAKRSTLAELELHPALPAVDNETGRNVEHKPSVPRIIVKSSHDVWQRTRSISCFTGKRSLISVSPEAEKNKQAHASSIVIVVASGPVAGTNELKNQCAGGRLLQKCFATALA